MAGKYIKLLLLLMVTFSFFSGYAGKIVPVNIDSVDYKRIQHKKVRKLIRLQKYFGAKTFNDIHTVCYNPADSSDYHIFNKSQLIRQNINVVWKNLIHQSPSEEFDGRIVTFGLLYSKNNNNLLYKDETFEGIEEGQILFFNLRVLSGIKNLAVALEVTRKDNDQKTIEYCYVDHGETKGTQQFTLEPTPDGFTKITQLTRYRCQSRLREHKIYAFFHDRIVKEFFDSLKRKSEKEQITEGGEV